MKKYAYVFSIGTKIVWSGDNEETLRNRVRTEKDTVKEDLEKFIKTCEPGDFMVIEPYGDMIFCVR
jgi:hypothetical protein